jgi:hypothetical protein
VVILTQQPLKFKFIDEHGHDEVQLEQKAHLLGPEAAVIQFRRRMAQSESIPRTKWIDPSGFVSDLSSTKRVRGATYD